jgi:hypothetical protein
MNEMNELEPLEAQFRPARARDLSVLRCWMPRHPSAALERRLFHRATAGPRPELVAGWLAPAAACLLFAGLVLNPQGAGTLSGPPESGGMVALILSNQSYAAYLPGSFQRTHNQLETFSRTASDGFFSPTNLIR